MCKYLFSMQDRLHNGDNPIELKILRSVSNRLKSILDVREDQMVYGSDDKDALAELKGRDIADLLRIVSQIA